ncbi:Guanine nucleotide-binding protein subunit alpha [Dirofilaria immitis]|nr:Guanine nucleotide-binding protein subunit alpha [Dirofilaria immitis]
MGSCQSQEAQEQLARNKAIEKQLNQDKRTGSSIVKLLLLGAGECGKSTVLKQMQILHSNGFTEDEINERKAVVYNNTVTSMYAILKAMDNVVHLSLENPEKEVLFEFTTTFIFFQVAINHKNIRRDGSKSGVELALSQTNVVEAGYESEPFTDELAKALVSLWNDKNVQKAADMRSEFQLNDSAKYFLNSVMRIHEPGYRPTEQDILFSRVATTGVVEVKFKIKELDFRVFDVGGQRSERRKWIHCFDNVESIIFITAVSEYDQVLFEDETTNRMIESMQLFSSICNSGQNYEEAMSFIKMKFSELNLNPDKKTIYMHETCATDTNQVQLVITSVIDTIIQKNLQKAGMM